MSWLVGGPPGLAYQREVLKRHDSTPPGSWLREQYEEHIKSYRGREPRLPPDPRARWDTLKAHPVEDAFDPGPSAYLRPVEERRAARDAFFRRLDEILGREGARWPDAAPVSDYVPQMARELYDDDDGA